MIRTVRRAAKVDANQGEIVKALRVAGATVQSLATVGSGCPDILVGVGGRNYLMELKDGSLPPSRKRLTPDEKAWHDAWGGEVFVIEDVASALACLEGGTWPAP
jgi:hypothetical protein